MATIRLSHVAISYPVRTNRGITLKEFLVRRLRRERIALQRQVDALRDISFDCADGERLGIIGYNGAGKSTLLRTIAGVYPVTAGSCQVEGSICSLFDISLGFQMEATGEENIRYRLFMQGETPRSIKDRIQPIVDFSELGDFIKLPIRCYSSGMLMRLAFSIATSSHPEILLIDEVFATGDLHFQKKAEDRMRDFMHRASILVMVGHNLPMIEEFCTRVLWLNQGEVMMDGPPRQVVHAYRTAADQKSLAA